MQRWRFLAWTACGSLNSRFGQLLTAATYLAYVVVALAPFQWDPPRQNRNGSEYTATTQELRFLEPGIAFTDSSWLTSAIENRDLQLQLQVRSRDVAQYGPARIFTISADQDRRNLTVAQEGADLVVRLRRPGATYNGVPAYVVANVFADAGKQQKIVVQADETGLAIRVNGETVFQERVGRIFSEWDRGFTVALGNEVSGVRPWIGDVQNCRVITAGREYDCLSPTAVSVPESYYSNLRLSLLLHLPALNTPEPDIRDAVLNLVCFIPCGLLMIVALRRSLLSAVAYPSLISFAVESLQIVFAGRFASLSDWSLNTAGAAVGAMLGQVLVAYAACGKPGHNASPVDFDAGQMRAPQPPLA